MNLLQQCQHTEQKKKGKKKKKKKKGNPSKNLGPAGSSLDVADCKDGLAEQP